MRVAICDDEVVLRLRLRKAIDKNDTLPRDAEIAEFADGASLICSHSQNPFDIIFLDIQMNGISGIEAGMKIRSFDSAVIIIFVTSFQQYVFRSLSVEIFDYIVKPIDDEAINTVLNRALEKYRAQHHKIHFKWQDASYALDVSSIVYLEAYCRLVMFITKDDEYECIGKLDEYECRLSPYGFLRCHRNALVNMKYIKSIESSRITTIYGHNVAMSVRKKQGCLRAFNTFFAKYRV